MTTGTIEQNDLTNEGRPPVNTLRDLRNDIGRARFEVTNANAGIKTIALQTARLRHHHGLTKSRATLLAVLIYGETAYE